MTTRPGPLKALVAGSLLTIALASAAESPPTITRASAEKTALEHVPGGTIQEGELETENGSRVWSFDIAQPGTKNIVEIQVDAADGHVVSVKTETPQDEAREKHSDAANQQRSVDPAKRK